MIYQTLNLTSEAIRVRVHPANAVLINESVTNVFEGQVSAILFHRYHGSLPLSSVYFTIPAKLE
jgi:hypothetical protein